MPGLILTLLMKYAAFSILELMSLIALPPLGFGTYRVPAASAADVVCAAIAAGWRHIDTAAIYRNEEAVGAGIRASGVPRDQLFVTTKLPPTQFGADKAPQGLRDSVARLALADTTVDLILLHWPGTAGYKKGDERHAQRRRETYQALLDAQTAGLCRYAGVSNYTVRHLEELEAQGLPMPVVNQVELHPRLPQTQLRQWCSSRGIVVQAYSPLGCGDLVKHPMVSGIAKQLGRSPAQVLLRWLRQQDIPFVVKSVTESRIKENLQLDDFELTPAHMEKLAGLADGYHYCWDPTDVA